MNKNAKVKTNKMFKKDNKCTLSNIQGSKFHKSLTQFVHSNLRRVQSGAAICLNKQHGK